MEDTGTYEDDRRSELTLLSVVVPCYDEESVIQETHERIVNVLSGLENVDFEIVYVDDGSRDGTLRFLRTLHRNDPRVRVVALSRNFGHQVAVTAGLTFSSGDAVAVIDADLQDPPEVILKMVERWRDGVDVAYGARLEREGETSFKKVTAKVFYRLINHLSDVAIPLDAGDFRLMDREVVDAFLAMPERDRFVRGMVAWVGYRQEPVYYHRVARFAGETKYPLAKMLRLASDGILSFSSAPLRLAVHFGFASACLAIIGIVYAIALRLFTERWVTGWTLLFIAMSFFGGVQLMFLGIMGEYVGRIYGEIKRRPLFLVKERLGFSSGDPELAKKRADRLNERFHV
jgi:glycosyltransferase involved in cell wall biosynthesis